MTTECNFRVLKFTAEDLEAFRYKRDLRGVTNQQFVDGVVSSRLEDFTQKVLALGFQKEIGSNHAARLPISDESLITLKDASFATGLPQTLILGMLLRQEYSDAPAPEVKEKPRKTTKKAVKKPSRRRSPAPSKAAPEAKEKPRKAVKKAVKKSARRSTKGGAK
ncbi:hypothetical protein [Rhodopirellula halodulae]|uniref:hypothetical protein n=1 Tax=Rhodopirellula halodulae TaxID=2894198 RepID=UPI001E625650|nr:hypothetical protein [Rhodopirellula sp. JC737]MCC9655272.1 hypothetical protein [Rhodopirellula sp. JC737]